MPADRPAVEQDGPGRGPHELAESTHHRGLAASALADQGQGFSLFQAERHVVYGPEPRSPALAEVHDQVAHIEHAQPSFTPGRLADGTRLKRLTLSPAAGTPGAP